MSRTRSPLFILVRDEFAGFAKSKVMLVLWFLMPAISILGYLALPAALTARQSDGFTITATMAMSAITSSLSGTIAGIMVAVDLVSERNRKVYDLFVIRPMRRETIIWSKFFAVLACVAIACVIAITAGIVLDVARGTAPDAKLLYEVVKAFAQLACVVALSAAAGVFFGILSRGSIVAAVILVFQLVGFFQYLPLLPGILGVMPERFWFWMLASLVVSALLVHAAAVMFRRAEL
jgi:ABC-type transport system involved in multi-copper enzyme maturation permease subunit